MRVTSLTARFPRRFFRASALRLWLSSRCLPRFLPLFFRRVGCSTPNTPRFLPRRHFCLLACAFRGFLLSSLRIPRFPRRRCTKVAAASTVAAGNDFAFIGVHHHQSMLLAGLPVRIDEFLHQLTSFKDIDSCEISIASTPSNCCCRLLRRQLCRVTHRAKVWINLPSSAAMSIYSFIIAIRHRVSPDFIGSRSCVSMAFTAESPPARGQ